MHTWLEFLDELLCSNSHGIDLNIFMGSPDCPSSLPLSSETRQDQIFSVKMWPDQKNKDEI